MSKNSDWRKPDYFRIIGYQFVQGIMPLYFVLMVIFTVGEVFNTLGNQPYMTRRMPSTHWGRVNSFIYTVSGAFSAWAIF